MRCTRKQRLAARQRTRGGSGAHDLARPEALLLELVPHVLHALRDEVALRRRQCVRAAQECPEAVAALLVHRHERRERRLAQLRVALGGERGKLLEDGALAGGAARLAHEIDAELLHDGVQLVAAVGTRLDILAVHALQACDRSLFGETARHRSAQRIIEDYHSLRVR